MKLQSGQVNMVTTVQEPEGNEAHAEELRPWAMKMAEVIKALAAKPMT